MPTLEKTGLGGASPRLSNLADDDFLFRNLPVGVYVCDGNGEIIHYNRAAAELWGREPRLGNPAEQFCGSYRLLDLDGRHISHADCPMAEALATGQGFRDGRIQIERPDGSRIIALVNIEPLKDYDGRVVGALYVFQDSALYEHPIEKRDITQNRFEEILRTLPAAVYMTDALGRITFYNDAAVEMWGVRPEIGKTEFCGSWKLYWPDGRALPHNECPMALALKERHPINGREAVAERPDGTRIPFLAYPTPLFDEAGELTGAVNMLVDIRGRASLELAGQRLASIVTSSDDAILSMDIDGVITSWNRGAERLFGYSEHEIVGKPVTMLIPDERQDDEPKILGRIRRGDRIEHYETVRRGKDGSLIDISLSVSPIVDASGRVIGASKIARDNSDRRRAEEQKDLLIGEMNHRVKNLFALAGGLVSLSAHEATSIPDLVSDIQGRFQALARAHSLTLSTAVEPDAHGIATLHSLVVEVTRPYLDDEGLDSRVVVTGDDIPLGRAAVTNIALLFHEFATNALKYGALADPAGQVRIECICRDDEASIVWHEPGVTSDEEDDEHEGFGSRLARIAVSALGGDFSRDFTTEGLEIRLTLPHARLRE